MPDEEQVREVMQRIATAALFYYPEIHADDPEYTIQKDLDWAFGDDFDVPADRPRPFEWWSFASLR